MKNIKLITIFIIAFFILVSLSCKRESSTIIGTDKNAGKNNYIDLIYPNPVNDRAGVNLFLSGSSFAKMYIEDIYGRKIMWIFEGDMNSGLNTISLETSYLPSGVYYCFLEAGGDVSSERFIVAR